MPAPPDAAHPPRRLSRLERQRIAKRLARLSHSTRARRRSSPDASLAGAAARGELGGPDPAAVLGHGLQGLQFHDESKRWPTGPHVWPHALQQQHRAALQDLLQADAGAVQADFESLTLKLLADYYPWDAPTEGAAFATRLAAGELGLVDGRSTTSAVLTLLSRSTPGAQRDEAPSRERLPYAQALLAARTSPGALVAAAERLGYAPEQLQRLLAAAVPAAPADTSVATVLEACRAHAILELVLRAAAPGTGAMPLLALLHSPMSVLRPYLETYLGGRHPGFDRLSESGGAAVQAALEARQGSRRLHALRQSALETTLLACNAWQRGLDLGRSLFTLLTLPAEVALADRTMQQLAAQSPPDVQPVHGLLLQYVCTLVRDAARRALARDLNLDSQERTTTTRYHRCLTAWMEADAPNSRPFFSPDANITEWILQLAKDALANQKNTTDCFRPTVEPQEYQQLAEKNAGALRERPELTAAWLKHLADLNVIVEGRFIVSEEASATVQRARWDAARTQAPAAPAQPSHEQLRFLKKLGEVAVPAPDVTVDTLRVALQSSITNWEGAEP